MERYTAYDNFAWLYNKEWHQFANNIFPLLKDIAGEKLVEGARVLDLCCGTGQLAKALTEKGYKVTGIDGSQEMLCFAQSNAPSAKFIAADARTFKLPPKFNAVFSTFDALNHIMTLPELQQVFKNVYHCLVSGGIFIFDMTTKRHFEMQCRDYKRIMENPDYFYAMQTDYDKENEIAQWRCTYFQRKAKGWQRSDVSLQQTHYPNTAIKKALKKAGFIDIRAYSASPEHGLQKPTKDSFRIFYYACKP
jgi:SAM-dependent methyltransferase